MDAKTVEGASVSPTITKWRDPRMKYFLLAILLALASLAGYFGLTDAGKSLLSEFGQPEGAADRARATSLSPIRAGQVVGFGYVDVDGGIAPLSPPAAGQVESVLVVEGQKVKKGEPLARLRQAAAESQLGQADAALREARFRLAEARRSPENHELQLRQQQEAIAVAQIRVDGQAREVDRLKRLGKEDVVSTESAQSALDHLRALRAALDLEKLKFDQLRLIDPKEAIGLAESSELAAAARRANAVEALAQQTLTAPEDGTVLRVLVVPGQLLGPSNSQPAIWFCPEKPRIVRCEFDQQYARRLRSGMAAEILDDAEDVKLASGAILRTSDWVTQRRSVVDEPMRQNDVRTLECLLSLDRAAQDLKLGERVRVAIRPE